MAQIYISSTYGDLKEHREKVDRALRQLRHDVVAMEDYVAADQRPLAECLEDVAGCELYVGIFAHRYGYIPDHDNPEGRSITELEYRHALANGKPCLVFLLDEAAPWSLKLVDAVTGDGARGTRIQALRDELGRERLVSFFTTAEELAQQVGAAVTNQLARLAASPHYQLREGLPTVPAGRPWTIPPPVRSFTGRVEQLTALHDQLTGQGAATLVPTAALTGMGGVGKTQLALAYAQRYRAEYELGWWVPAETELGMVTALADLGASLGLSAELPAGELAAGTRDALGGRSGWLLVFDNAPEPAVVTEFLPGAGGGHVLVTSRDSAWQGIADPIPVDLLSLEDSIRLLLRRSGDTDKQVATQLAEELERLPLALEQAAAYAAGQRLSLADYFQLFGQRRAELLALGKPLAYRGTVDATFTLAIDQLRDGNPAAVQLLELCALMTPDEIPLPLLLGEPQLLPEPLAAKVADPIARREIVGGMFQSGLLARDTGDAARMHRLVQSVILSRMPEAYRKQRTSEAVTLLSGLFPSDGWEPKRWPRCAQLLAATQAVLAEAHMSQLTSPGLARLLIATGDYLSARGLDTRLALGLHEQAVTMNKRLYDGDHPDLTVSLTTLAIDLRNLGEYERARELDEQALAMDQRLYEGDHDYVATSMTNLATDLRHVGEHERARELDEEALAMYQRLYEGDDPAVADSLMNLAIDMTGLGEHERARELDEEALAMRRRLYDGDHPGVALGLANLAVDLRQLGEHERARELDEEALAMRRRLYDGDHPEVAHSLANLAGDLRQLGEHERGRELDEEALAMYQRLYEGDHPAVANSLVDLADDMTELGEHDRAGELNEQAVAMYERLEKRRAAPDN